MAEKDKKEIVNQKAKTEPKKRNQTTKKKTTTTKKKETDNKTVSKTKKTNKVKTNKTESTPSKSIEKKHPEVKNVKKERTDEITKLVEIILVILVIFAAFYVITTWVDKSKNTSPNVEEGTGEDSIIQYDEILIGNLFMQEKDHYYVLIMDGESKEKGTYTSLINAYQSNEEHIRLYTADLKSVFNQKYKAEEAKLDTDNIDELRVKEDTLVEIEDHKIKETFIGSEAIQKKLAE